MPDNHIAAALRAAREALSKATRDEFRALVTLALEDRPQRSDPAAAAVAAFLRALPSGAIPVTRADGTLGFVLGTPLHALAATVEQEARRDE